MRADTLISCVAVMPVTPSVAAVSRIAYLSSDVLVNSQSPSSTSPFVNAVNDLARSTETKATVYDLPFGADPGATLLRNRSARLLSFTVLSNSQTINHLVLHLAELSSTPTVLHVAVVEDLSDALVLRSSVPFVIYSRTAQQAHDNALVASRLAFSEGKAVLHVFHVGALDDSLTEVDGDRIAPFLFAEKHTPSLNGHTNGVTGQEESTAESSSLLKAYQTASLATVALIRRPVRPFTKHGHTEPHTVIFTVGHALFEFDVEGISFINLSLVKPLPPSSILSVISPSTTRMIVAEQVHRWSMKWTPLYLEIISTIQQAELSPAPTVQGCILGDASSIHAADVLDLLQKASSASPSTRLSLGTAAPLGEPATAAPHVPKHESAYTKILSSLFGDRLEILNSPSLVPSQGQLATTPEFALGRARGELEERAELVVAVQELLQDADLPLDVHALLSKWVLAKDDGAKSRVLGVEVIAALQDIKPTNPALLKVLALRHHLPAASRWIIGSDAWSYDLGASGLHHAVASQLNVNVLILDTLPYSSRNAVDPHRRKQDVGLYAMNHGDVYVASVAVYSSYSQVLQALVEADGYDGPSVVVAYLPYTSEETPALQILKETKLAVDAAYWPLYRWNPAKEREGKEPFALDSDAVKNDLQQFLDRQNHLSQLVRSKPEFAAELVGSLGENLKQARKNRAQQTYNELLTEIDAPPLLVLYASDGGRAEKVAKRLATRGKLRGLSTTVSTMDAISVEDLAKEEYVAFVTSVAGQGEFPQNGRSFLKALNALAARGEKPLTNVRYSVFGLGDSHYWPRPEDAHYYNKAGKDLNARLEQLGAQRFADLGLGDDQDADGPETGYKLWEPLVWKTLGVDTVEVNEAEPEPITNEHIKRATRN
ncbi:Sulfite reductase [NADPH] subunit beta [Grifola frondosa]|uniref:Sulfite reductase [NADPH] subunit beta n=1 Tax=Grifola frondosa TaxID=5627 RepID=A0A1C7MAS7_GRIFR|nr:Sulfite reductase [NADPH] subunit beta [Grifola frondosa]